MILFFKEISPISAFDAVTDFLWPSRNGSILVIHLNGGGSRLEAPGSCFILPNERILRVVY